MYHKLMKTYLTNLYDSIVLKQLMQENNLNQTASWNIKNRES